MGIVFGLNEDAIKSRLKASAAEVRDTVYKGDDAAIKAVLDKSWIYMQRAHLHAGGMGTTALSLTVLLCVLGTSRRVTAALGVALGSTGAAKESLKWLAMPSSGAFVLATVAVLIVLVAAIMSRLLPSTAKNSESN